jgi:hypothetical protein
VALHDLSDARCVGLDPELFFDRFRQTEAKAVCGGCPVRAGCLQNALTHELEDAEADGRERHENSLPLAYGVWGATPGSARRSMRPGQQIGLPETTPKRSQARIAA